MGYIDLFAGAGGLSEGFKREGFEPIAHIEKDHYACQTIKTRLAYHYLNENDRLDEYKEYLLGNTSQKDFYDLIPDQILDTVINEEISEESLENLFESVDEQLDGEELDLIVGGPPCQAYSLASAHIEDKNEDLIYLYELYGEFLRRYEPRMFVFENVPGLYTADDGKYFEGLKECFEDAGYQLDDEKLDSSNFNVPQKRKRVIIVGWHEELDLGYPDFEEVRVDTTINKLFKDLPSLKPGESINVGKYSKDASDYVNKHIRNGIDLFTHHIARPHNDRDLNIYEMAIEAWTENEVRLKNSDIPEEMRTQKNTSSFLDRFKVVDGDGLSHTMIAHIAKDGHYYIHPDINQLRSLSVREAARIQSFPDDYYFEGPRTSVFTQIGNAVPPLLAQSIAKGINKELNGIN
ncbi:DNA cytosine methyltransferase [Fodinibius sp. SL11]|uniref:DNA cytosine methyltransferase n=1 Tax=Fodinibius sp. SL11 TaxID=3425690 RepID=UPI003F8807AF